MVMTVGSFASGRRILGAVLCLLWLVESAQAQRPQTLRFEGVVASSASELPIEGARLTLFEPTVLVSEQFEQEPLGRALSGADGTFRFAIEGSGGKGLRFALLLIEARGFASEVVELAPLRHGVWLGEILLRAARQVELEVVTSGGSPVAGAWVTCTPLISGSNSLAPQRNRTNPKGLVRLALVDAERYRFFVSAVGLAPTELERSPHEVRPVGRLRVVLERGRPVELRVSEGEKAVAEAFDVFLNRVSNPLALEPLTGDEATSVVRVWLAQKGRASLEVLAGSGAFASQLVDPVRPVEGTEAPTREPVVHRVALKQQPIRGRVEDPGERPVPGAAVWFDGAPGLHVLTDQRGEFVLPLPGISMGSTASTTLEARFVRIASHGHLPLRKRLYAGLESFSAQRELRFVVQRGHRVRVVVEVAGRPAVGSQVTLLPLTATSHKLLPDGARGAQITDLTGTVELLVPFSGQYDVAVWAPGFTRAARSLQEARSSSGGQVLRFALTPARSAIGWLSDESGRAVEGAWVRAIPRDPRALEGRFLAAATDPAYVLEAQSDAQGRFELVGIRPGSTDFQIEHPEYADLEILGVELDLDLDPVSAQGRVETPRAYEVGSFVLSQGLTLAGVVLGPDGEPMPGADVVLGFPLTMRQLRRTAEASEDNVMTDEAGIFRFDHLNPGEYRLRASAPGFAVARLAGVGLKPGADKTGLELRLGASRGLEGTMVGEEGAARSGRVSLHSEADAERPVFFRALMVPGREQLVGSGWLFPV